MRWEEKLFWLARGYRVITFVEITCIQHGSYRSAIQSELEAYPCPVCRAACRAVLLGEGVTRHELPPWELVEKPFAPSKARRLLMAESIYEEGYRPRTPLREPDRHRRKIRAVAAGAAPG